MKFRLLGRSGLRVSELCLGAMTFGTRWGWGADEGESRRQLDIFADRGGTFIDTANFYTGGESEEILGRWLADSPDRRDRTVLATKYTLATNPGDPNACGNGRKNMMQAVEASLRRLQTDFIDLYWVHAWDRMTPVDELMRGFDDLVRQGKIRYAGVSDFPAWKVAEANTLAHFRGWSPFIGLQVPYSLVRRDIERELLPMARELGLGVTPWSPLGGGVLTGKYTAADMPDEKRAIDPRSGAGGDGTRRAMTVQGLTERKLAITDAARAVAGEIGRSTAQVAVRWVMQKPGVTSTILGARTVEQLEDNLGALEFELSAEQMARLDQASAIEPGFPSDFLNGPNVTKIVGGGVPIDPTP